MTLSTAFQAPASAAPAGAASLQALALTGGDCERLARRYLCSVSFSGATAPTTIRWFSNSTYLANHDNKTFVGIGCQPGFSDTIRAVITDATGASVEFRTTPTCASGNP